MNIIRRTFLSSILVLAFLTVNAQEVPKIKEYKRHMDAIKKTINDTDGMMPPYLFDSLAFKFQDGIAGTQVKEGKIIGTSLSVDEKSATANIGLVRIGSFYFAGLIAGRSDNKFVSLVKDGKYQQTASFGGTFNIFLGDFSGKAYPYERILAHRRVDTMLRTNDNSSLENDREILLKYVDDLKAYKFANDRFSEDPTAEYLERTISLRFVDTSDRGEKAIDTLKKLGFLEEDFDIDGKDCACQILHAAQLLETIDTLRLIKKVNSAERLFKEMPWTQFQIVWITGAANYNVSPEGIIHPELPGKDHYLSTFNHEYAKVSIAFNYSHVNTYGRQFQFTASPGFNFSSIRNFKEDEKIKLSRLVRYEPILPDSASKVDFSSEGYEKIASRANVWSFELPMVFLWNKSNVGIDFAVRAGGNDPLGDNVGGRIGFFIPIDLKENVPIWIEPVVRFQKLFDKANMDIWKDNMAIGFNLSVAIKKHTFINQGK